MERIGIGLDYDTEIAVERVNFPDGSVGHNR